ncbi:Nucleoside-diphosphate-sugar pyrophosphorylase family protein [Halovivax ruber XH-70]|uniref:Bifunctional protein GlmU n=1 Tax=Halovivax ruber (strain DSM 18193 / JCM 13892 / XH-70) TaxID=797302 RepID=L0IGU3_HALRX|nr:sugar phosphate nucleotidyltransferase [Halovivax ruber]AGB17441.1 Nucleoside-diphosphate-sugar pyrophosphorylase family protein [Halovivax ruber XH-70]
MSPPSAVVLAAGEGTRLRPLTTHRPKPMLPGATKPILEHVLDALVDGGLTDITLVVGYGRNRVQAHFGPRYRDVPLRYVTQETQLGTGHALVQAQSAVDGPCLVVYGDQLVNAESVDAVVTAHSESSESPAATLAALDRENVAEYGGLIVEDGRVREIVERPRDDRHYLLNAGIYLLEPRVFDAVRAVDSGHGEQSLVDAIDRLIDEDSVRAVRTDGLWADATYPWDLLAITTALLDDGAAGHGVVPSENGGVEATDGPGSPTIHETAVLRQPVAVDPDCEIGPGAVVGPFVALGANVTVAANAVVERCVLDRDTRIGANAVVRDTVTGVGVELGSGSTIPGGPGDVRVGEQVHTDAPLGALLADRVTDGGGVTYAPGTVVGAGAHLATGATVDGTIEAATEVRS